MALTLGSSLQAGRYTLEETLFVDDYCTTYRATQHESSQPVALQVLNAVVGPEAPPTDEDEAENLHPLQKEFLATARDRISHPPSDFPTMLDSFVEQGLPVVVFEYERDRPIPTVKDWLPSLEVVKAMESLPAPSALSAEADEIPVVDTHQASQPATEPEAAIAPPVPAEMPEPALATPSLEAVSAPTPDAIATPSTTAPPTLAPPTLEQIDIDRQFAAARAAAESTPHSSIRVTVSPRPTMVQRLAIPLGLLLTAAVTGGAGAAIGWHLRHGEAASDGVPILGPLLTKEQAFPPIEGWPSRTGSRRDRTESEVQSRPRSRSTADYIPISEAPIYYDRQHRLRARREAPTEFVDESLPLDPVPLYRNTAAPLYSDPGSSYEEPVVSDPMVTDGLSTGEGDAIAPSGPESSVAAPPAPSKLGQDLPPQLAPEPAPVAVPAAPAAAPVLPPAPTASELQPATSLPQ